MASIGIRCYPDRYAFVVLEGTQNAATILDKSICRLPDASWTAKLQWARKDIQEILNRHEIDTVQVKTVEGNSRTKDTHRIQLEGVLIEGAASHSSEPTVETVVAIQIKKKTGFTSFPRYLGQLLDNGSLQSVSSASFSEAALSALAGLEKG